MNASIWQLGGALAFGLMLGWNVYFVNRYRKGEIGIGDIATLVGVVAGAAVLHLFDSKTDLFGAYGIGLGVGFFSYFALLLWMVKVSPNFDTDWFLDGRRKNPAQDYGYGTDARPTLAPMALMPPPPVSVPNVTVAFHGTNPGEATMSVGAASPLSAPNPNALRIQQKCIDTWSGSGPHGPFKNACNYFLIEVAHELGIGLSGTADQIIDTITDENSTSWVELADGSVARDAAANGKFVIAGVKSDAYSPKRTEGHVSVVTAGPMNPGGWAPAGYWGSTDPKIAALGGSGIPISNCFTAAVKDKISYRYHEI